MVAVRTRNVLVAVCASTIAACAGGSGGGGGTGGGVIAGDGGTGGIGGGGAVGVAPDEGGTGELVIKADRTSFDFVTFGNGAGSQSVNFTLLSGAGTYHGFVVLDRANLFSANLFFTSPTTATATIAPTSPPAGTTTGSITFQLCKDSGCNTVSWWKRMPYTVTAFSLTTASLSFSAVESQTAASQALALMPADDQNRLTVTAGVSTPWLTVARSASSAYEVTASAQTLPAGSYQGEITVAPPPGDAARKIPVTFTVAAAINPPADATVVLDLAGSLAGSIPVTCAGGTTPTWTATSNKPWLTLTQATGTGAGTVTYAIDSTKVDSIVNGASDVATVQIAASGYTTVSTKITLEKHLPEIYMASPLAVPAGKASTLHVFGKGFSQIKSTDGMAVSRAANAVTTVISDSEATVAVSALAAGRATVSVPNPFSIATRAVDVAVAVEGQWSATKVARTGERRSAFFDPLRNAVYASSYYDNEVIRFQLVEGAWKVDAVAIPSFGDLGISADHKVLYVTSGSSVYGPGTLRAMDADTLQLGAQYDVPSSMTGGASLVPAFSRTSGIQVTNNGRLWFNGGGWAGRVYFDLISGTFGAHSGPSSVPASNAMLYEPGYFACPDGSRMLISQPNRQPAYFYTSADDRVATPSIAPIYYGAVASRDGRIMVVDDHDVVDTTTWAIRGRVKGTGSGYGTKTQVSPDGSKVYLVTQGSAAPVAGIDVYDAANVEPGTTDLAKLGEIPVVDQPAMCASSAPSTCSPLPVFLVGPLGDVLFLIGNEGLVVVPIPDSLRGAP